MGVVSSSDELGFVFEDGSLRVANFENFSDAFDLISEVASSSIGDLWRQSDGFVCGLFLKKKKDREKWEELSQ